MDADYLAERIIKDLDGVFCKDPLIADFEILPVEECTTNKCPVIHVAHQVGLESWCMKHVFNYTYKNILNWKANHQQNIEFNNLLGWTRALLLINPDIQVAWNIRKELIVLEKQDLHNELKFSAITLSRKPKSAEVLIHRRWLLNELMKSNNSLKLTPTQGDIEFQVCSKASEHYFQNYYAWSHRIWVTQRIDMPCLQVVSLELQNSDLWIQKHISDSSGFHYRQFLFSFLLENASSDNELHFINKHFSILGFQIRKNNTEVGESIISLLLTELETNCEMILFYEGYESLWYHRRFILYTLKSIVPIANEINSDPIKDRQTRQTAKRTKLDILKECFNLDREEIFIEKIREKNKDKVSNAQNIFLEKHIQWKKRVLAISLPLDGLPRI